VCGAAPTHASRGRKRGRTGVPHAGGDRVGRACVRADPMHAQVSPYELRGFGWGAAYCSAAARGKTRRGKHTQMHKHHGEAVGREVQRQGRVVRIGRQGARGRGASSEGGGRRLRRSRGAATRSSDAPPWVGTSGARRTEQLLGAALLELAILAAAVLGEGEELLGDLEVAHVVTADLGHHLGLMVDDLGRRLLLLSRGARHASVVL
jgi:hypothetical protein